MYIRLLAYARPYWPGFLFAAAAMLITAATETAFAALMKPLLDEGFSTTSRLQIWWVPTGIMSIFLIRGASGFVSTYAMSWIAQSVLRDLRQALFEKFLVMPASSFDTKSSGQLISRIIAEVNGVTAATTSIVSTLVRDTLILVGLFAWLVWLNWKLTMVVLVVFPLLAAITLAFSRRMRTLSRRALSATGEMTRIVEEVIFGNRIIKIFQGREYEQKRFFKASSRYRGQVMRLMIAQGLQTPLSQLVAAIGVATVITVALVQSRAGAATIGDFVSFITAMLMMMGPLKHLADINVQLQRGMASAEAVFQLIDEKSEIDQGTEATVSARGYLRFEKVSLTYPGKSAPALSEVSVEIKAGETVALVGPSGGGKTSFVNLIPRLYEPSDGSISLDGVRLRNLTLQSLRSQIALVSQDIVLFNDTISNNVAYGITNSTEIAVREALHKAGLATFIESLPMGIETAIGDRGVRLSGGQKQRIAIARAFLKDSPILILDEATSALDSASEAHVKNALDQLRFGRTTIVIAHRLETVKDADRILVFDMGKITEQGDHQTLMERRGLYASLYQKNFEQKD